MLWGVMCVLMRIWSKSQRKCIQNIMGILITEM
jgi:hypothetical protein